MDTDLFIVDGSFMEGGGQILRVAIACSCILNKPIEIHKIRAGRPKPGLSNQHLAGIQLASELCNAQLSACKLGSTYLKFVPNFVNPGNYQADAKTAGSISLLLQISIPILAFSGASQSNTLKLKGGTDAKFAPPIDYINEITNHYFEMFGLHCRLRVRRRGFYPQGGGVVDAFVEGISKALTPINLLESGQITHISGYSFVAGKVPMKIAHEMKNECVSCCAKLFPSIPVNIDAFREDDQQCVGNVSTFLFIGHTQNGCKLAVSGLIDPRGPHHTQLVRDAISKLSDLVTIGACCDDYMQDQFGFKTTEVMEIYLHSLILCKPCV